MRPDRSNFIARLLGIIVNMPPRPKTRFAPPLALVAALVAGCQEPTEIIPVAPPGLELTRVPAVPVTEAQALGEQPAVEARQNRVDLNDKGAPSTPVGKPVTLPSGLTYETLVEGTGAIARRGNGVEIEYTGKLDNGTVFDSSRGKAAYKTTLGSGQVIPGWDQGIPGMLVGERRKLIIPAALAYGAEGRPGIPGGATLTFEVELMSVN